MKGAGTLQTVVVLYGETPASSVAVQSFLRSAQENSGSYLLIYDNSPARAANWESTPSVGYEHHPENPGVSKAYNRALELAREHSCEWVLLLDQDTKFPANYLDLVQDAISQVTGDRDVVAIIPQIKSGARIVSPVRLFCGVPLPRSPISAEARWDKPFMAINSGAVLRVSFIQGLSGFSEEFPLDGLDHWWSGEIWKRGRAVYLLATALEHDLSIADIAGKVSLERYRSVVQSEVRLYRRHRGVGARVVFGVVLVRRVLKFFLRRRYRRYGMETLRGVK